MISLISSSFVASFVAIAVAATVALAATIRGAMLPARAVVLAITIATAAVGGPWVLGAVGGPAAVGGPWALAVIRGAMLPTRAVLAITIATAAAAVGGRWVLAVGGPWALGAVGGPWVLAVIRSAMLPARAVLAITIATAAAAVGGPCALAVIRAMLLPFTPARIGLAITIVAAAVGGALAVIRAMPFSLARAVLATIAAAAVGGALAVIRTMLPPFSPASAVLATIATAAAAVGGPWALAVIRTMLPAFPAAAELPTRCATAALSAAVAMTHSCLFNVIIDAAAAARELAPSAVPKPVHIPSEYLPLMISTILLLVVLLLKVIALAIISAAAMGGEWVLAAIRVAALFFFQLARSATVFLVGDEVLPFLSELLALELLLFSMLSLLLVGKQTVISLRRFHLVCKPTAPIAVEPQPLFLNMPGRLAKFDDRFPFQPPTFVHGPAFNTAATSVTVGEDDATATTATTAKSKGKCDWNWVKPRHTARPILIPLIVEETHEEVEDEIHGALSKMPPSWFWRNTKVPPRRLPRRRLDPPSMGTIEEEEPSAMAADDGVDTAAELVVAPKQRYTPQPISGKEFIKKMERAPWPCWSLVVPSKRMPVAVPPASVPTNQPLPPLIAQDTMPQNDEASTSKSPLPSATTVSDPQLWPVPPPASCPDPHSKECELVRASLEHRQKLRGEVHCQLKINIPETPPVIITTSTTAPAAAREVRIRRVRCYYPLGPHLEAIAHAAATFTNAPAAPAPPIVVLPTATTASVSKPKPRAAAVRRVRFAEVVEVREYQFYEGEVEEKLAAIHGITATAPSPAPVRRDRSYRPKCYRRPKAKKLVPRDVPYEPFVLVATPTAGAGALDSLPPRPPPIVIATPTVMPAEDVESPNTRRMREFLDDPLKIADPSVLDAAAAASTEWLDEWLDGEATDDDADESVASPTSDDAPVEPVVDPVEPDNNANGLLVGAIDDDDAIPADDDLIASAVANNLPTEPLQPRRSTRIAQLLATRNLQLRRSSRIAARPRVSYVGMA